MTSGYCRIRHCTAQLLIVFVLFQSFKFFSQNQMPVKYVADSTDATLYDTLRKAIPVLIITMVIDTTLGLSQTHIN